MFLKKEFHPIMNRVRCIRCRMYASIYKAALFMQGRQLIHAAEVLLLFQSHLHYAIIFFFSKNKVGTINIYQVKKFENYKYWDPKRWVSSTLLVFSFVYQFHFSHIGYCITSALQKFVKYVYK